MQTMSYSCGCFYLNVYTSNMDNKIKHLEFVQGVINRLSTNSFLLKGWTVVLVSALVALGSQASNGNYIYLALMPAIVFWGLDGYFLWQERLYRAYYNYVRGKEESSIDFSMNVDPVRAETKGWMNATFSPTLIFFHGVLILAIIVVMCFEAKGN